MKVQGRLTTQEKTPNFSSKLGQHQESSPDLVTREDFGNSRNTSVCPIFPSCTCQVLAHLQAFLHFQKFSFFILESTNNTKPRAILFGYTREIQPRFSRDDILTALAIVFSVLIDILVIAYPFFFFKQAVPW